LKHLFLSCLIFFISSIFIPNLYAQFEEQGLAGKCYEGRFLVYASNHELARKIGEKVRMIYEKVIADIGYSGAYKTKYQILIWENKDGYMNFLKDLRINIPSGSIAVAIYNFEGLPTIAGYLDEHLFANSLPHEFTHLIIQELLNVPVQDIPLWLNEGLAIYESNVSLRKVHSLLRDPIKTGNYIKLEELLSFKTYPLDSQRIKLFYLEAQSLINFLFKKRKNREDFFSFLRWHIIQNYPFEKAYLYSYGNSITMESFEKEWFEYINEN
jgi:hypothetical protein